MVARSQVVDRGSSNYPAGALRRLMKTIPVDGQVDIWVAHAYPAWFCLASKETDKVKPIIHDREDFSITTCMPTPSLKAPVKGAISEGSPI